MGIMGIMGIMGALSFTHYTHYTHFTQCYFLLALSNNYQLTTFFSKQLQIPDNFLYLCWLGIQLYL